MAVEMNGSRGNLNGKGTPEPNVQEEPDEASDDGDTPENRNSNVSSPRSKDLDSDEDLMPVGGAKDSKVSTFHSRSVTWITVAFCSVATVLVWLMVLHFILESNFFKNIAFAKDYVLKKPDQQFDPAMMHNIGEMVANGTLLSLDDFWSFQSSLYQTIITVLIALNGIIAAFSFFIIKTSSNAKAREEARAEARDELKKYLESTRFVDEVKRVVRNKVEANLSEIVRSFQFDLEEKTADIAEQIDAIALIRKDLKIDIDTIERINREHEDFKRYIAILAKNVSLADRTEDIGADLTLGGK